MPMTCKENGCTKNPSYNYSGLVRKYCFNHKKDGMINVRNRLCVDCNVKRALYNYKGSKGKYCFDCKIDDMICVGTKLCKICSIKHPQYNYDGLKPEYCHKCKLDNMTDVKHLTKCIFCNDALGYSKYDGHCIRCFIHLFPENTISTNYKVKERHVTDYINDEFPNEFIFDKSIYGGCSRKRPDAFRDCLTHSLIIEIDENQHKSYEEICENKRMMEIFEDLAHRPIVFIRFNPDSYIDEDGNKVKSCFVIEKKTGILVLDDMNEWIDRICKLKEEIEYHIENIPTKEVTIVNLFYNDD